MFKENPIAILGEEDVVLGFKALGFRVYIFIEETRLFEELLAENILICLVQDKFYKKIADWLREKKLNFPILLSFSFPKRIGFLEEKISEIKLKAIGRY